MMSAAVERNLFVNVWRHIAISKYLVASVLSFVCVCTYSPPPPVLVLDNARTQINFIPPSMQDEPVIITDDSLLLNVSLGADGKNQLLSTSICYFYINKRNPTVLENLEVYESPGVEALQRVTVHAYYPDGSLWQSDQGSVQTIKLLYDNVYQTDDLLHRIAVPRYAQGMLIRLEVCRNYTSPEYVSREFFREVYPVLKKRIVLSWPQEYTILHMIKNEESIPLDTITTQENNAVMYTVSTGVLPKIQTTNKLKYPEQWYAGLHFSIPPIGKKSYSWRQLSDHYLQKLATVFDESPIISQWGNSIKAKNPDSVISQAFAIQQKNVRYYANLSDEHSFIPRNASVVAEKGYGDCKEMASLLKTVCHKKNVELGIALVNTEGNAQCLESVPTLGTFNHAIAYYTVNDSLVNFYDPTVYFGTAADSYFHCIGQKAFMIRKGTGKVVTISQGLGYTNSIETVSTITGINADGRWIMNGTIYMRGKSAFYFYPAYSSKKGDDATLFLSKFLLETFNINAITSSVKSTTSEKLEIEYTADIQRNYLSLEKGGVILSTPSIFTGDIRYTTIKNEGPRYLFGFEQKDTWHVPKEFIDLEKNDVAHTFGHGSWAMKKEVIERNFVQNETVVLQDRKKDLNSYFSSLTKCMKTTCWK